LIKPWLLADGKVRALGVSNFMIEHLTTLLERATIVPAVNQIECHPYFAQRDVQDLGAEHGILTQAWSPIGGNTFYRDGSHGSTLDDPRSARHGQDDLHQSTRPRTRQIARR
jgi:diketogulonate reductase-like aldo/keto reductase